MMVELVQMFQQLCLSEVCGNKNNSPRKLDDCDGHDTPYLMRRNYQQIFNNSNQIFEAF